LHRSANESPAASCILSSGYNNQQFESVKLTENRKLLLSILDMNDWGDDVRSLSVEFYPPMTCFDIINFLDSLSGVSRPSIKQIERTMRDLSKAGLVKVVKQKRLVEGSLKCEKFVNHFELPHQTQKNELKKSVIDALWAADCLIRGTNSKFQVNRSRENVARQLKAVIQKTHPDRHGDNSFVDEFNRAKVMLDAVRNQARNTE
jgi:hypothetical protein